MEKSERELAEPSQPAAAQEKRKTPRVVIAHRVLSSLAICFGIMWILIGVSLMQASPPGPSSSFSSGPGSQRVISSHSSERDKAPTYVAFGVGLALVFAIGLFLKASPAAYVYHTILLILLIVPLVGLVLSIWWFGKRNRNHYGLGLGRNA